MTPGIHLVHKPLGSSSFSIVQSLRAQSGTREKMCHGGALDPFASGLLLILVEPATQLFDYLHDVPKTYEATLSWGIETDNGDPTGKPIFVNEAFTLTSPQLDAELEKHIGWQGQTPPAMSNKRIGGERAYVKAHRGEPVELPSQAVYLHEARWLGHDFVNHQSRMRIVVKGGYYVRSLARDLGRALGCGAHLAALHRTSIGPWTDPGGLGEHREVHGRDIIPWLPARILNDQEIGQLRQQREIDAGELLKPDWPLPERFPVSSPDYVRGFHLGRFAFMLRHERDKLAPVKALAGTM